MESVGGIAWRIANGHAFESHVINSREYPTITSQAEFAALIADVISEPDVTRSLSNNRVAYWQEKTKTVVIVDPYHVDRGTAFRPRDGKAYIARLV